MNIRDNIVQIFLYTFFALHSLRFCVESVSTRVPGIACPDVFQYVRRGTGNAGRITLLGLPFSTTKVEAHFSQHEPVHWYSPRSLALSQNIQTTKENIKNNLPVMYDVHFPNPNIFPKLTQIIVNDNTICTDTELPSPSSTFVVRDKFFVSQKRKYQNIVNNIVDRIDSSSLSFSDAIENIPNLNKTTTTPSTKLPTDCGLQSDGVTPFVVGGTDFYRGKFPWLTAIYLRTVADLRFTCGGSLISRRTVITAAHCFLDTSITADRILVLLGRHNLFATEEGAEQRDVQKLIKHPEFNVSTLSDADVAILQLRSPVGFTQYIRPICLWTQPSQLSYIEGQKGYVAGWGADNQGTEVSQVPKMAEARIVSESECLRSSEVYRQLTSTRTICAGNRDGTGPCIGDSGGGLMINIKGVFTLRGIISGGQTTHKNCKLLEYIVYCDIAKNMLWVLENIVN